MLCEQTNEAGSISLCGADFCSKQESGLQSLQNCSNLARGSSSHCGRSPAEGAGALLCDGSEGWAQPWCQAGMCRVPAGRWSWTRGHSRERLPSSPRGCCASVRAGKGSPFNVLVWLLVLSRSLSQNRWLVMGQSISSGTVTGKEGLHWLNWWREVAWCQLLGAVGNQANFVTE